MTNILSTKKINSSAKYINIWLVMAIIFLYRMTIWKVVWRLKILWFAKFNLYVETMSQYSSYLE